MKLILKFNDSKYNKEIEIESMRDVYKVIDDEYSGDTFNGWLRVKHPDRGQEAEGSCLEVFQIGKEYILDIPIMCDDCTIWQDKDLGTLKILDDDTLKLIVKFYDGKNVEAIISGESLAAHIIYETLSDLYPNWVCRIKDETEEYNIMHKSITIGKEYEICDVKWNIHDEREFTPVGIIKVVKV